MGAQTSQVGPLPGEEFVGPFASWANVRTQFGAAGDGYTDDTNAFQAALDSLAASQRGSVLYVPAGTYRITRTLTIRSRIYISVIGEHPYYTTLTWGGPAGVAMLNLNGVVSSQFSRLTFNGNNVAAIGIDQSWDGQTIYFDTHNQYSDDVFRNLRIGIRGGHLGYGAADSVVLRCQFYGATVAGISIENWNALNWFIRDSYFQGNYVGVTNTLGAGNFYVYNSVFLQSSRADVETTQTQMFALRNNVSSGSGYFVLANPIGTAPNPLTLQNNVVLDPVVQAVSVGNAGPLMLLDNIIRSRPGQPAVTVVEGYAANPVNANVVSVGNTFTTSTPYSVAGRLNAVDDTVTGYVNPGVPGAVATPVTLSRAVYEIPVGSSTAAIQQAINTAIANNSGSRPIVHLQAGTYFINQTLLIPAGADVQLIGDGGNSALLWSGSGAGPVLQVTTGSHAALRDFRIHGNNQAKGILVNVNDQPGGQIFMDQAGLTLTSQNNLLVDGLDHTLVTLESFYNDSSQLSVRVLGGPLLASGQSAEANVNILGGGDGNSQATYSVDTGGRLLAEDVWYEGAPPGFANLSGSGAFTLDGANIYNEDPGHGGLGREIPPITVTNFSGSVSVLNAKIGRGGINISGSGAPRVLGMGIDGPLGTPNYFQNYAPGAQTALLDSSLITSVGGSTAVPDQPVNVSSIPAFMRLMLAQVRGAKPYLIGSGAANATDLRFLRVDVEQSTVGIHLKAIASAPVAPPSGPTVAITAPSNGQTVSRTVTVSIAVSSGAQVQFTVDNVNASATLDTTTVTNGAHTLTAKATDANNNSAVSSITIVVNNPAAPPASAGSGAPLITGFSPGSLRNNFGGWVGMQFTVGSSPLSVTALGRIYVTGNTGLHVVKLVRASDGTDVSGSAINVALAGGTAGQFAYGQLPAALTLAANTSYFLVSQEAFGGDQWYDQTPVSPSSVAGVNGSVYWSGANWVPVPGASRSYVPVNLLSAGSSTTTSTPPPAVTASPGSGSSLVTGFTPGPARNNFTGWVGMQFTVSSTALTVNSLGRVYVTGNSGSHTLKLVRASDGSDVAGGTVSVSMAGGSAGQFTYAQLPSAITLQPNTAYYLVSQETLGGDQWYDYGSITASSVAGVNGPVYWSGVGWIPVAAASNSYVPVSLLYSGGGSGTVTPPTNTTGSVLVTGFVPGPSRNNYTGWVGMQFTVGSASLTVSSLGRIYVSGNSGSHVVKLVRAGDGVDVAGGSATVSMAGGTSGQFSYGQLSAPVTLPANTSYFLVSQETYGGDQWFDDGPISITNVASVNGAVYWTGVGWFAIGNGSNSYVPVNMLFTSTTGTTPPPVTPPPPPPTTALVTGHAASAVRNDFSGWVGMQFTVGATPLTVTALSRIYVPGNAGTHTVKIVNAGTGADVPGASVSFTPSVGTPGQFVDGQLGSAITLNANTSYYLVSQETYGGDQWYDYGPVSTTSAVTVNGPVYSSNAKWILVPNAGGSYVPVSFTYR